MLIVIEPETHLTLACLYDDRSGSRADGGGVVQDVEVAVDGNHGADIASNPTGDERFAAVFQSADFEMDPSSGTCFFFLQQHCLSDVSSFFL